MEMGKENTEENKIWKYNLTVDRLPWSCP